MNWKKIIPIAAILAVVIGGLAFWQVSTNSSNSAGAGAGASVAPSSAAGTVLPVTSNPISNTSTTPGLSITSAMVENNVDPATGVAMADRLQVTLKNATSQSLSGLEIYYQQKDATTGKTEAYYQKLDPLTLAPNSETTIYFDNQSGAGHYPENKFSIYRSSTNQVDFTIEASATGMKTATATAKKSPGTGEKVD
jgi:hypothetical protein